jgi:nucleolar protein 58
MQMRENAATTDFEGILEEEVAADLKEIATISMGTEISADDISNISALCDQVVITQPHQLVFGLSLA